MVVATSPLLELDVQFLTFLSASVVPLLVGLLTKLEAPKWLKLALNFALSTATAGLTVAIQANGSVELYGWLTSMAYAFAVSLLTYHFAWKPSGVASAVQWATMNVGIGGQKFDSKKYIELIEKIRAEEEADAAAAALENGEADESGDVR